MDLPKLLITGFDGIVGKVLWRNLGDSFELYGLDRSLEEKGDNVFEADITNLDQVNDVFDKLPSIGYVVHLAGDPRPDADWQSVVVNNIVGTRNLYEAAQTHGVKRVIFASSNHITGAYEGFPPDLHTQEVPPLVKPEDPIRPDGYYGVGKAAGEALARMYYDLYGLESVCLRIGAVMEDDDPTQDPRNESLWLSHKDLVQLVKKSLMGNVKFAIYFGVSNNRKRFFDISNAVEEIGYQPESDASAI